MPRRPANYVADPPPPDHLRCRRSDGKQWRCPALALPGGSLCDHHHRRTLRRQAPPQSPPPPPQPKPRRRKSRVLVKLQDKPMDPPPPPPPSSTTTTTTTTTTASCDYPRRTFRSKNAEKIPPPLPLPAPSPPLKNDVPEVVSKKRKRKHKSGQKLVAPPDRLRCTRSDGRGWRCSQKAMASTSFCEYHYALAKRNEAKHKGASPPPLLLPPPPSSSPQPSRKRRRKVDNAGVGFVLSLPAVNTVKQGKVSKEVKEVTRYLPNGLMTISRASAAKVNGKMNSGAVLDQLDGPIVHVKVGFETPVAMRRCVRSKNAEPVPVGPIKEIPGLKGRKKKKNCHQCGRTETTRIVKCKACRKQNFCFTCIEKWYPGRSRKDIKVSCPVCRRCCNCKICTLSGAADIYEQAEAESDKPERIKIKYADYLFSQLLPLLKINREQLDELEIEAKIQGTRISSTRVQAGGSDRNELPNCNHCKQSAAYFLRSCPKCSYNLCLTCCQKMREGNLFEKVTLDTSGSPCRSRIKKSVSKTINTKQKLFTSAIPQDQCNPTKLLFKCKSTDDDQSITCPPKEFSGCGNSLLSLIFLFPSDWSAELSIGVEGRASAVNCSGGRRGAPSHCSSQIESSDNLARYNINHQEAVAI